MAIHPSQRRPSADLATAVADATAPADAAALGTTKNAAAHGTTKKKSSRRTRMILFAAVPVVAVALGTVSASVGLIGSKKAPAPSAAQQASTLLNAGLTAQGQGHIDVATRDYQQVLALDPKNKFALYDLALIAQQAGQSAQADSQYRQALIVDPNFAVALFNLAILRTQPAPQEAIDLYRHAITLNPKDAASHLNLGFLLDSQGVKDEARSELKLAVGLDPKLSSRVAAGMLTSSTPAPVAAKR
jgi:tetratricopeptide (TPR) repeat protein